MAPRPSVTLNICRWAAFVGVFVTLCSHANSNGLVVYLSDYLTGDYYFAPLPELMADPSHQSLIQPVKLNLPKDFRRSVELGNHDISRDGTEIVFAARNKRRKEWDIYTGKTDYTNGRVNDVVRIVSTSGVRDEDPRFDWSRDANGLHRIVYKCGGDICMYTNSAISQVIEDSECELWAPSFNSEGSAVSYARRCDGSGSDRIWYAYLNAPQNREQVPLPGGEGGPDRFAHFQDPEALIYSHILADTGAASLWRYHPPTKKFDRLTFNTTTNSDDDAYPDKSNPNRIAYIGWQAGSGYNLFIYEGGVSYKLSHNVPMLAPAIFQIEGSTDPPGAGGDIVLDTNGYKVKGLQKADLSWTGATGTDVDVLRDGVNISTTDNDGAYTDSINRNGRGSYTYQVCEAGTSNCSNESVVAFN